jgi:hypothetical protein
MQSSSCSLCHRPATEDQDSAAMDSSDPDAKNFHDRYTSPEMAAWTQMYHFGSAILIPARVNDPPRVIRGGSF